MWRFGVSCGRLLTYREMDLHRPWLDNRDALQVHQRSCGLHARLWYVLPSEKRLDLRSDPAGLPATLLTSFGPPLVNMALFALVYPFVSSIPRGAFRKLSTLATLRNT